MKTSCLLVILWLLIPAGDGRAGTLEGRNVNRGEAAPVASWPADCMVKVYFVEHMFTAEEKELLWNTIETWTQRPRQKRLQIRFVLAGETGGLIDCVGCLTIARQVFATPGTRQRVSFNVLRENGEGRLMSAWIGFERAATSELALRTLMLQVLDRGLAMSGPQTTKGIRP